MKTNADDFYRFRYECFACFAKIDELNLDKVFFFLIVYLIPLV